ncbi:MAG: ABC transporter permease [Oceanicoccus sp.]|uniref:PhnE/PtxC family ABC transporter permease n=1 Tax=Oceanicoccus sp. TaxID=2691044 RepID=UPI0026075FCC|nr:ABC transporter permease [Oceanicoccus sp.]MCP3908999.1 ABC transporter permease [Oceanicoccus sp.]MDG1771963.1 ABC transporter permease [Oceanicoccus sp.]
MISAPRYHLPTGIRSFLLLLAAALLCLPFADIEISNRSPWQEFAAMAGGFFQPTLLPFDELIAAIAQTFSYAFLAVCTAAVGGLFLSLFFHQLWLRSLCAAIRSVHELFWGLLFIQLIGIHPLAGYLAIALPYTGIFAKVFAEIIEEHQSQAVAPRHSDRFSHFFYAQWPQLLPHFRSYSLYRLECGLRSSTVLGFIGLPTLGFHLETAFMQGLYSQAAGILFIFYIMIASLRWWMRPTLLPLYFAVALFSLWGQEGLQLSLASHFLHDIIPLPIRNGEDINGILYWLSHLGSTEIGPGIGNTLVVTQIALLLTAVIALCLFPFSSRQFFSLPIRFSSHLALVILRSTPELIIAFALLLLLGPSMLPAIIALAIHNGAIIANLISRHSHQITLRLDASKGFHRYCFEIMPRIYGQFLAFLCYRWEVILRESAILGILGVHTLGFYIDSAFESFRLDVAVILIAVSALLNILVDQGSRQLRHRLHLRSTPQAQRNK